MRLSKNVSDKELYDSIFHWKFEDNLSWNFCSGILEQNYGIKISIEELKRRITKYIKEKKEV